MGRGAIGKLGVMFSRSSKTRIYAEAAVDQELIEIGATHPTLRRFNLGIGF